MKINFDCLSNTKMLQTVRVEKVDEKMGSFVEFSCFLPELLSLSCIKKKCFFAILC